MQVLASNMDVCDLTGECWKVSMTWNAASDVFSVSWHKISLECEPFTTLDNLPGCIPKTVNVFTLNNDKEKLRGVQFWGVSRFPLSPTGNTLLVYIDVLKRCPGFECTGQLVKTLGRGEDFLAGLTIPITILMKRSTRAAA